MNHYWNSTFRIKPDAPKLRGRRRLDVHKSLKRAGRRTKSWIAVWAWLKPRLEKAGRTSCEFGFIPHECSRILDPVHAHKRREAIGIKLYYVAIGCRTAHDYVEGVVVHPTLGRFDHAAMERAVMMAINNHGGLVLPEAQKERKAA